MTDRVVLRVAPGPAAVGFTINSLGACLVLLARLVQVPGMSLVRGPAFGALASGTAVLVAPVVLAALGAALDLRTAYLLAVLPLTAALAATAWKEPRARRRDPVSPRRA